VQPLAPRRHGTLRFAGFVPAGLQATGALSTRGSVRPGGRLVPRKWTLAYALRNQKEVPVRDRRIQLLLLSNTLSLATTCILLLAGFGGPARRASFQEIDVERINVVGSQGKPVMVLTNRQRMPGPSMNGKDYPPSVSEGRNLLSGMLFFNEQGDEVGGL